MDSVTSNPALSSAEAIDVEQRIIQQHTHRLELALELWQYEVARTEADACRKAYTRIADLCIYATHSPGSLVRWGGQIWEFARTVGL